MAEKLCELRKKGGKKQVLSGSGMATRSSITCEVGDIISATTFHTSGQNRISGGTLIGSWTSRDVGGSTFLSTCQIKATSTTVGVGGNIVYMGKATQTE